MGWLKRLWNSTIFPDMIRQYREEKDLKRSIRNQARLEAIRELKDELREKYKQDELDRMSGKKKKDWLKKLADNIGDSGKSFEERFGMNNQPSGPKAGKVKKDFGNPFNDPDEKIRRMLGGK